MRKIVVGCAGLLMLLLSACGITSNSEAIEKSAGISEDFCVVAEDFSERFLVFDQDGARYDEALNAVSDFLDGDLSQNEAEAKVKDVLTEVGTALDTSEAVTLEQSLKERLTELQISSMEYELFANSRISQLQIYHERLSTLLYYLEYAEVDSVLLEELRFLLKADQMEQEGMRGYYYYGCFNYWFPQADEAERLYLNEIVSEQLTSYYPSEAKWYTDTEEIEQQAMEYLDLVETIVNLEAEYLGQAQERYYEMERDYEQPIGTQAP